MEAEKNVKSSNGVEKEGNEGSSVLMAHCGAGETRDMIDANGPFEATECLLDRYCAANAVPCPLCMIAWRVCSVRTSTSRQIFFTDEV